VLDLASGDGVYAIDIALAFTIPLFDAPASLIYAWQPTLVPQPETIVQRVTDWDDGGVIGDKFVQGCRIEADTGGVSKSFSLQSSDDLTLHALVETPIVFNGQSTKTFSVAVPFISHSMRLVPDTIPWRLWRVQYVFEPYPSLAAEWQTELISHGLKGWQHIREINVPYLSTAPVTLKLVFDDQSVPIAPITIPSSAGVQQKLLITVPANKFKLVSYGFSSSTPGLRLWKDQVEVKVGPWGRTDAYSIVRPFGGTSKDGAEV
jgi:hypothetical protein